MITLTREKFNTLLILTLKITHFNIIYFIWHWDLKMYVRCSVQNLTSTCEVTHHFHQSAKALKMALVSILKIINMYMGKRFALSVSTKNIFLSVTNLHGLEYFCKCSKYTYFVLKIYRFFWKNNIVTKRAFKRVKMYRTFCVINYRLKSVEQRNLLIINKYCIVNGDCLVTENSQD